MSVLGGALVRHDHTATGEMWSTKNCRSGLLDGRVHGIAETPRITRLQVRGGGEAADRDQPDTAGPVRD